MWFRVLAFIIFLAFVRRFFLLARTGVGWMHAHNSLRAEMSALVAAVEAVELRGEFRDDWEVDCIQKAWAAHYAHIHAHHSNEDAILVPYLKTRFKYPEQVRTLRTLAKKRVCFFLLVVVVRCTRVE